ncbi:response regulator [Simiduia aestuariiviva]|uniref:CheY-like chemotaxis protein n=1 Tax=Simiduia aestuariiviva TaxID=1510459 RepID=A0A839UP53_9GAMM|nr:response regulator [Simiduia aestuariiviva]MBB3167338.1 CheY-like chemotaxis protein [Simiduia aestuariiviva]
MSNTDITLLLIEDDDVDAMTIERSFRKQRIGNKIVRADDGEAALELIANNLVPKPFIILLDLNLPKISGHEFLDTLRKDPANKDAVVFVLTTSSDEQDMLKAYEKFIAGYFVKSESGEQFMKLIGMLDGFWRIVKMPEPGE